VVRENKTRHRPDAPEVVNFPPLAIGEGKSRDLAGKAVQVSGKLVDHATKVIARAIPEVIKAVDEGRMSVTTTAVLTTNKMSHP